MHVFSGLGLSLKSTTIALFPVWNTICLSTSPKSKDLIKKGTDGEPDKEETQQYKDDHKARSVIKLTLEKSAFKLCKDCKSAQEMMKILKD